MSAEYAVHEDVAVITLNNPPVNGLGLDTRRAIVECLERAESESGVKAIVLTGKGKAFSGGADIREFGTPKAIHEPNLLSVISRLEKSTKPVIASVHSVCMGGGLELALGAHFRVVAPGCEVALPEVKLGLVPGAGGTQRLPRALGVEVALNMIVSGNSAKSEALVGVPGQKLFDKLATSSDSLLSESLAFAREMALQHSDGSPYPLVRNYPCKHHDGEAYFQFVRNMVKGASKDFPAPVKCVDAVEAATRQNFEAGMQVERGLFLSLLGSTESRALRHLFAAERAASKVVDVTDETERRVVRKVAVIGAGTMGGGIAMCFINAGIPVVMLEVKQDALDRGLAIIRNNYESQVKKGKLRQEKYGERIKLLTTTLRYDDLGEADLVIEAVFEDMGAKEAVFKELDRVMKSGAILASNTSTLDLNKIAAFTKRPEDVVGLHFFSPANVMKLLEVVRGSKTSTEVMATVMTLARKIKKTAVVSGVCDGFIGNRMIEQYIRQAGFLLDEGCTPDQVDRAIEKFGFAMGPFRMGDLAGNDIGWALRKRRAIERPELTFSKTFDLLCAQGRFGQKVGKGWYDYGPGKREAVTSPSVLKLITDYREARGIAPRRISDNEIVERLVFALVNEAAYIVEEGIASKASDIDVVYIFGYGFPVHRGGPLNYANEVGLFNVVEAMKRFAKNPLDDVKFWQPAPLLARLAAEGETL